MAALRMRVKELEEKLTDKANTGAVTPKPRRSPMSQPATPKTTLPAVASEDEEEAARIAKDQDTDWLHPYRRGKNPAFLQANAPTAKSPAAIASWIEKLKLARTKKKAVEELTAEMLKAHNDIEPAARGEDVARLAVEWGLPIKLTSNLDANVLIKVIAVAVAMTK